MTHAASPPRSLRQRIIWARKRKGISQENLAKLVGTSRRHVMRWERETKPVTPRRDFRERLAEVLDQEPAFFEDDEDDEEADSLRSLTLDEFLRLRVDQLVRERTGA